jgi:CBS domain-containing protein
MVNRSIHTIPVVERGKLVGVIGKEDILRTLVASSKHA